MENTVSDNHTLTIDAMKKVSMTGITAVESFNDKEVTAKAGATGVSVSGEGLNVTKFNTENGTLVIDGRVTAVKYHEGGKAAGVFKKIFK